MCLQQADKNVFVEEVAVMANERVDPATSLDDPGEHAELDDDLELAVARLEWAKASRCLDIPEQATAVRWHAHACDEARGVATADDRGHG
jgi:hypothetical protein